MYGGRNVLVILNPHGGDTHAMSVGTHILFHPSYGKILLNLSSYLLI